GLAVGLFLGLSPTVGFQAGLALPTCLALRANFPRAFAPPWVSNPVTVAPLYMGFNQLGEMVLGQTVLSYDTTAAHPWLSRFAGEGVQMLIGRLAFAVPAATFGYVLARRAGRIRK
ncbi:MAG: DUF2062 domain-containing protein, partial [Guyparkeria sp.]